MPHPHAPNHDTWSLSVVAWDQPSDPRTLEGIGQGLTSALKRRGALRHEYSAKRLSPVDALAGAVSLGWHDGHIRKEIRRDWMWTESGSRLLTHRTNRAIRHNDDSGPFLQFGTLVELDPDLGPHYVLADMTVPQAHRTGTFAIGRPSVTHLNEAVALQARILRSAAHTFTLSDWARRSVIDDFGIDPAKVTTVYAGPNLHIPPSLSEPRARHEILFVGTDWERNGGPLLVEAFALLRQRLPDATLQIIGCQPAISSPGVTVDGVFDPRNPTQFEQICRCHLRAACFCLPSLFDPFPMAIIDAASAGLPVVTIDNGSRREAVIDGQTGALAPEPTAPALAQALYQVLDDTERSRRMGHAARAHANAHFTWQGVVDRIARTVSADLANDRHNHRQPVTSGNSRAVE